VNTAVALYVLEAIKLRYKFILTNEANDTQEIMLEELKKINIIAQSPT